MTLKPCATASLLMIEMPSDSIQDVHDVSTLFNMSSTSTCGDTAVAPKHASRIYTQLLDSAAFTVWEYFTPTKRQVSHWLVREFRIGPCMDRTMTRILGPMTTSGLMQLKYIGKRVGKNEAPNARYRDVHTRQEHDLS